MLVTAIFYDHDDTISDLCNRICHNISKEVDTNFTFDSTDIIDFHKMLKSPSSIKDALEALNIYNRLFVKYFPVENKNKLILDKIYLCIKMTITGSSRYLSKDEHDRYMKIFCTKNVTIDDCDFLKNMVEKYPEDADETRYSCGCLPSIHRKTLI